MPDPPDPPESQVASDRDAPGRDVLDADAALRSPARWVIPCTAVITLLWVVWRTGPGQIPNVQIFTIIADGWPTIPMGPETSYVLRVPLGQLTYKALPWTGVEPFLKVHAVALGLAGALLMLWFWRQLGDGRALVAGMVVLCAPVTAVLLLWVGMYDAFSVLAWCAVLFSLGRSGPWQLAAGAVAGFQNFEQVVVGLTMLALLSPLTGAARLRVRVGWLLGGAVVGKGVLEAYLASAGATPGGRQTFLSPEVLQSLLSTSFQMAPLIVWSCLGGLWGFALAALVRGWRHWTPRLRTQVVLAVLVWFGAMAITADHSRVLAMTSFPVVAIGALVIARETPWNRLWRLPEWWVLLLAPPLVVFGNTVLPMGVKLGTWGIGPF